MCDVMCDCVCGGGGGAAARSRLATLLRRRGRRGGRWRFGGSGEVDDGSWHVVLSSHQLTALMATLHCRRPSVCVCVCVCVAAWGEHLIWSVNMIIEHMSMDFLHVFRPAHLPWRLLRRLSDADVEQRRHYLVSWGRFCVQEDVQLFLCCHDVFPKDYRQLRHEAGRNLIWILKWITQSHCELANES